MRTVSTRQGVQSETHGICRRLEMSGVHITESALIRECRLWDALGLNDVALFQWEDSLKMVASKACIARSSMSVN